MLSHRPSRFCGLGCREVFPGGFAVARPPARGPAGSVVACGRGGGGSRAQGFADRATESIMSGVSGPLATVRETGRFSRLVSMGSSSTFRKPRLLP
jgi:hypothetical protein